MPPPAVDALCPDIVALLAPITDTIAERNALLNAAFSGTRLLGLIDRDGSARAFCQNLCSDAIFFGTLDDGTHALDRLLEAARMSVGLEGNRTIDHLQGIIRASQAPITQATPAAIRVTAAAPVTITPRRNPIVRYGATIVVAALVIGVVVLLVSSNSLTSPSQAPIVIASATPDAPSATPVASSATPVPASASLPFNSDSLRAAFDFRGRNADWTPVAHDFGDGVTMVLVPVGCLQLGSEWGDADELPVHTQCFDETPFWIDQYEVTNEQFARLGGVAGGRRSHWADAGRPRERITWFEARDFCALRGARLPTEVEWEYAARGVDNLRYPWGDDFIADNVVYVNTSDAQTAQVGSRPGGVSWVGAYDMSGNVWEWTSSLYLPYPYDPADGREDAASTESRVLRGGSWFQDAHVMQGSIRGWNAPDGVSYDFGFRCVRPASDAGG